jgi:hypothetical protein
MARSLMELYGGGMGGPTTNYQLGGRIARARRGSEYQGEQRRLREQAEKAARRQKRAGGLGSLLGKVGAVAGSFIPIPGVGTALGSAIGSGLGAAAGRALGESTYTRPGVGEGKYLQKSRGDVKEYIDAYKEGQGERALTEGLSAAYKSYAPSFTDLARDFGIGGEKFAAEVTKKGIEDNPWLKDREAFLTTTPSEESLMDFLPMEAPVRPDVGLGLGEMVPEDIGDFAVGAMPEPSFDPLSFSYDDMIRHGRHQGPMMSRKGGGLINYMVPKMQGGGTTSPHGYAPALDPMGTQYGYGTATDPLGALKQMGMAGIAADPNLAQYMGDLPQFGMGYEQQIGDIRTGAQKGLLGLAQAGTSGAGGFAGSGAPQVAAQRQREQMMEKFGQQRRGVVEGYQADVLGAIRDIEQKGEFEFQSPWGKTGETEEDWRRRTAAEQDLLSQQGTQLYSQQGLYGLQDPTQGQTGLPGQQQQQQQWGQAQWGQQGQQQQNPWQQQQQQTTTGWPTGG